MPPEEEAKETVETVADEVVETIVETADDPVPDPPPAWAVGLIETVEEIADKLTGVTDEAEPVVPAAVAVVTDPELPADGHEIPDDASPAKPPWTHRGPFNKNRG